MKKVIKAGDTELTIRRAKYKEIKDMIKDLTAKGVEVAEFFSKKRKDNEFIKVFPEFLMSNFGFIEKYILQFTPGLTQNQLENMDFLDIIELCKQIIIFNGISEEKMQYFFQTFRNARQQVMQQENEFIKEIPKQQ